MKSFVFVCLCGCILTSQAAQVREVLSPVTRVVKLLQSLSKQIEEEGKKEEDMYESFVCWGKSVISQKTDSNAAAQTRIDALEQYISDLDSGKVELTSERQELEKEIEELTADLETAKALREKEKKDFEGAKDEMDMAIKALTSAVKVMKEATKDNKKGALLAYHSQLKGGIAALEAESASLNAAVDLGERFLTKADADFLRRVLYGDVPKRDEKMLRKKADFKMAYKTRSGKIQDVLAKLKFTFENNLKDAKAKEKDAQDSYDKLSKAKGDQLKKAQDAKSSMAVENGARGVSKAEAEDEAKALKENIKNDKRFIKQTEDSLEEKQKAWDIRTKLRNGELEAISKAISILYNDDARDNFKKSFASQEGFFFLQEQAEASQGASLSGAVAVLKKIARTTGDRRLSALAALAAQADPSAKEKFKPIIESIDKMIKVLKADEKEDLETKETCEKDRMENTRKALLAGRDIDEKTDAIRKLESEIEELKEEIKKLLEQKKQTKEELDAADKIRKEENAAFKITDEEDGEAASTVKDAIDVLKGYYSKAFKFIQQKAVPVVEGEAPPPPPATWEEPYGGKKGESTGIMAILEMVYNDIKKDQKKAKEEEDQAQKEFDTFKEESEKEMKELQEEADKKDGIKGKKETDRTDTIKERKTKKGEWDEVMKTMKDISPNCEYYAVNYKMRVSNRQIELDGLEKAKAILSGGSFK
jgi:hypothetical protein